MANSLEGQLRFISKADTLYTLSGLLHKSSIEQLQAFVQRDWQEDKDSVIKAIKDKFKGETIIIRSSALNEDTAGFSNAGSFRSVLNVDSADDQAICSSVESVFESYREKNVENPDNQILIQKQTLDTTSSGTILTRDYNDAPYYIINYSEEDTISVTSGRPSKMVKILKSNSVPIPAEFSGLIDAVREIEQLTPVNTPLDIEFGKKKSGDIVTFQARPLVIAKKMPFEDGQIFQKVDKLKGEFNQLIQRQSHLAGETTFFGDMPDWNPAEIIGNSPHSLAVSLYDEVITNAIWHQARTSQGYTDVNPAKLVVQFGNKPYVDIRNTFNSFIPASISPELKEKLLQFYTDKLKANPQMQDKVEFDILYTCYDLSFNKRAKELLEARFYPEEVAKLKTALLNLTNNLLNADSIAIDIQQNEDLERYRQNLPIIEESKPAIDNINRAIELLDACKKNGTLQFSRLARIGFIGKIILKSMVEEGIIDDDIYHNFLESITSIASAFSHDAEMFNEGQISKNDFIYKYGHLRPGTYDITVPRYDMSDNYFGISNSNKKSEVVAKTDFELSLEQHQKISRVLSQHGLTVTSQQLFKFIRAALEAREYSKFLFSKSISDGIEAIASAGRKLGFSREDLSYLDIQTVKETIGKDSDSIKRLWESRILQNKASYNLNSYVSLPPIIFSDKDFEIVSYYDSRPNYITAKKIMGDTIRLVGNNQEDVAGKVVMIESADPGYDWVFAKKPIALITKYGGPASHMAIRCAELGLPAVIGAGDMLYESLLHANSVIIDCENQRIESKRTIN